MERACREELERALGLGLGKATKEKKGRKGTRMRTKKGRGRSGCGDPCGEGAQVGQGGTRGDQS
eukprot:365870-Lingulodinium_polyedra.AAC.1